MFPIRFTRSHLQEREARLLFEAGYPCPPGLRFPGRWRLSQMGFFVPPIPSGEDRWMEIAAARELLTAAERQDPAWDPQNHERWTSFFTDRRRRLLNDYTGPASTEPERNNREGRKAWWGMPGRSLDIVLDYIEQGNSPPLQAPPPQTAPLARIKEEPSEAPVRRTPRGIVIGRVKDSGVTSGGRSSRGVAIGRGKEEPGLRAMKKKKTVVTAEPYDEDEATRLAIQASLNDVPPAPKEFALAWSARDHQREDEERRQRIEAAAAAEERHERRRRQRRQFVVLEEDDDDERGRQSRGDDGAGCSRSAPPAAGGDDDSDEDEDYTILYSRLGIKP